MAAAAAAQSGAQILEVRELAELRRQRAVQVIRPHAPVTARGAARYFVVSARPLIMVPQAAAHGTAVPRSADLTPGEGGTHEDFEGAGKREGGGGEGG